ncbi:hypothetical protein BU17DRAFT_92503 [Hysterangium stoloniferum]|nr:hypothetical protein BU17DRAFT_92503 [Hysterangium stoloniferum]
MHPAIFALAILELVFSAIVTAQNTGTPTCVTTCLRQAFLALPSCSDFDCACKISTFQSSANICFGQSCSANNAQIGEDLVNMQCGNVTSTSIPPGSSTSLTVTNSETSPPQSSPVNSTSTSTQIVTVPPTTTTSMTGVPSTSTSVSVKLPTSVSTSPLPSITPSTIIPSGTIGSVPASTTTGNVAVRLYVDGYKIALFVLASSWAL